MSRLKPGLARVEYLVIQEEVTHLLGLGHTYASAYDILKKKNKITMCYATFREYANGTRRPWRKTPKGHERPAEQEPRASLPAPATPLPTAAVPVERQTGPRIAGVSSPPKAFGKNDFDFDDMTSVDNNKE